MTAEEETTAGLTLVGRKKAAEKAKKARLQKKKFRLERSREERQKDDFKKIAVLKLAHPSSDPDLSLPYFAVPNGLRCRSCGHKMLGGFSGWGILLAVVFGLVFLIGCFLCYKFSQKSVCPSCGHVGPSPKSLQEGARNRRVEGWGGIYDENLAQEMVMEKKASKAAKRSSEQKTTEATKKQKVKQETQQQKEPKTDRTQME